MALSIGEGASGAGVSAKLPFAVLSRAEGVSHGNESAEETGGYTFREQAFFVYGTGLAIGLHLALVHVFIFRTWAVLPITIAATFLFSSATLGLWRWVFPRLAHLPSRPRLLAQAGISVGVFAVTSVLVTEGNAALTAARSLFQPYTGGDRVVTIPSYMIRWAPLVYTLIPIAPTAIMCVIGFNHHWWRIFRLEGRQRELQAWATSAQLAALRAQMNPHFFFNSLNSIAQLISSDPRQAERCVEQLAEVYRYLLRRSDKDFVPLTDELKVTQAYLEIERARFGDELRVQWHVDPGAGETSVPAFVLQPLVENAVRHGVSGKLGGGVVRVEALLRNGDLELRVSDTGAGIADSSSVFESGVALRNIRERLVNLYGPAYAPEVRSRPGEGTSVRIRIPVTETRS
ncbi:MAG: hypothetical protein KatS3mg076_0616 [Candidatus Binatia bacterium]|nr:MAG: hypothetical protein KatS3mg076_0616 [Candidatus Binatia bacterium]